MDSMLSSTNTYNYYWKLLWKRQSEWQVNTQGLCLSILIPQSPLPSVSGSSFAKQNLRPTSLGSEKRGRAGLGCAENAHQMLVDFCLRESLQRTAKLFEGKGLDLMHFWYFSKVNRDISWLFNLISSTDTLQYLDFLKNLQGLLKQNQALESGFTFWPLLLWLLESYLTSLCLRSRICKMLIIGPTS